ncbi:class I SAM-dependent methyltransferase [Pedobacter alpinus]|uniref:Class I SAM-dependent methyltransferase n=1 Tax=Pedobacter alpinus TaxID=1590643 RepID=A0ABW5TY28_9SPHI
MQKSKIITHFNNLYALNKEQKLYLTVHSKRFEIILNWLRNKDLKTALDIGPSFLSELLYPKFQHHLYLMGFDSENSLGGHLVSNTIIKKTNFIAQDLNFLDTHKITEKFDLIICAEVLEHLYTSPNKLFRNLFSLINKEGYLIIQTPNAVALRKRLLMVFGKNPFEIPRENLENPGHYREYTLKELKTMALKSGFTIDTVIQDEYFEYPSLLSKTYRMFKKIIPPGLRSGITLILKKAK